MKNNKDIRTELGLSQREMAMMLGVHLSQWSMFEGGRRNLPLRATQLLADLLAHVKSPEVTAKTIAFDDNQRQLKQQYLEALLQENQYQCMRLAKKVTAFEKKQSAQNRSEIVVNYLRQNKTDTDKGAALMRLPNKKLQKDEIIVKTTIDFEIKKELLELEKLLIESKLLKINTNPENTDPNKLQTL